MRNFKKINQFKNFFIIFFLLVLNGLFFYQIKKQEKIIKQLTEKMNQLKINEDDQKTVKVTEVFDGDSFAIEGGYRIRLANVSAPEINYCLGKEAKKRLEDLILGKKVRIEELGKDKFGRMLAFAYQDSIWVNQILLEEGWGRYEATSIDKEKDKQLLKFAHQGQQEKKGVYSSLCTQNSPPNSQCQIKANIDKKLGKKIYHFPGCAGYNVVTVELDRGERWFCREEEAIKAGFRKSEQCYGKDY